MPARTGTIQISETPIQEVEIDSPVRRKSPRFAPRQKPFLLLLLIGSLATLFLLHILATHLVTSVTPPDSCAGLLGSTDYPRLVDLQPQRQEMAAVQVVNGLAGSLPAALVQVTNHNQQNTLDVSVFSCVTRHKHPVVAQIFSQRGLIQGSATITPEHTLRIETLDTAVPANEVAFLLPLQQNIYREYAWRASHFAQVLFPGFYPVTSQAEAEVLQQNFDQSQDMPWNDPVATALQMSRDLLQWNGTPRGRLVSQSNGMALVELTEQNPRISLEVTLRQLIQTGSKGLWFVTGAHTAGLLLTGPEKLTQPFQPLVNSPVHINGADALIDGRTTATLFNHTLMPISQVNAVPLNVRQDSSYSGLLSYPRLAGDQQGVLLIQSLPRPWNGTVEPGQLILVGVLLN